MEVNKWVILLFCTLFLFNCKSTTKENIKLKDSYQIYKANDSTIFYIQLYDQWGESNDLGLIYRDSYYLSNFEIDPIPIIKDIRNDTIVLDYYCGPYHAEQIIDTIIFKKSDNERINKIGKYTIMYHKYYFIKGEGILSDKIIDSIYFDKKTLKVSFYKDNRKIKELNQRDLIYKKDKNKFCYFEIDTINKNLNWHYLSPNNNKITETYFKNVISNVGYVQNYDL